MKNKDLFVIINNVRSVLNVGSIFRTADAIGVKKIYLCGITPTPDHSKFSKTALGAEKIVPWEYHKQAGRLVGKLKVESKKLKIIALERLDKHTASKLKVKNIFKYKPKFPLVLILGNEVTGLSPKIIRCADDIMEIPMYGRKESLNVSVAFGVAGYQLRNG